MEFEVYLVGGAVRGELLGRPVADRDWLVIGACPIDGNTVPQGVGSSEFARIPTVWLDHTAQTMEGVA